MRHTTSLILLTLASIAGAQTPTFDVASVKPSVPSGDLLNINLGTFNHGVVTLGNTTLSECIRYSYGLVSEDQISGPEWIRDRSLRVDITAKTAPDTPIEQVRLMMQSLLAERFHLEIHHEAKPVRHFDLSVSPKGFKLHESPESTPTALKGYGRGRLFYDHLPMRTLAVLLSRQLQQPVLDLTGLTGFYDIHLEWTPDDPALKDAPAHDSPSFPDVYHAIQEQLGLQLEPKRTPIDVIVVDRADKVPVAN